MKILTGILIVSLILLISPVVADMNVSSPDYVMVEENLSGANYVLDKITGDLIEQFALIQNENNKSAQVLSRAGLSGDEVDKILKNKVNNLTYAHSSLLISPEGIVKAAYPSEYSGIVGKNLSYQNETADVIRQKKPVITNIFPMEEGFHGISITYPIFSKEHEYLGYTDVTVIPEEFLKSVILPVTDSAGFEAMVIQKDGTSLYEDNEEEIGVNVLNSSIYNTAEIKAMAKAVVQNETGIYNYTFWNKNWDQQVKKQFLWRTIKPDEQEWRVGIIRNVTGN